MCVQLYSFSDVTTKENAAGTCMQTCLMPVQVDVMELQSGLLGWQVEKLTKCIHPAGHSVSVRMGPFFRLNLDLQEGGAMSGALELTQPGSHLIAAWQASPVILRCAVIAYQGGQCLVQLLPGVPLVDIVSNER